MWTRALRAELHDLVALLFHFFVLFEQLGALGLGVLPVAYPHRALLLRGPLDRLQPLVQFARRGIRPGQGLRDVTELGEAALEHTDVAGQLGELRLLRPPRRGLTLQPFERRDLLLQPGHGRELGAERAQLFPGSERVGELLVEPLEFLARRHHRLLRHTPLAVERQRARAPRRRGGRPRDPAPPPPPRCGLRAPAPAPRAGARTRARATGTPPAPSCRVPPSRPTPFGP